MQCDYCKADNNDLIDAWNMFADTGMIPAEFLRPSDYTSWIRCNHKAVYKKKLSSNIYFSNNTADTCLKNNSYQVMNHMERILSSAILRPHYALLLTDAQGKPFVDIGYKDNQAIPWEKDNSIENHAVLKALDVACKENRVIEIYGYEHLYRKGNNWHTIGHPIFNFDKSIAGGFGVICQTDIIPVIVPIVKIGAELIQSTLILEQIARNNIDILIAGNRNAALAINEYGVILNANTMLAELLNMPMNQLVGRELTDFVSGDIDNNLLFSTYDGFNQAERVYLTTGSGEAYKALMTKSIIGNYRNHPLFLLSFLLKKNVPEYTGAVIINNTAHIFDNLIGSSPAMRKVKKIAQKAAGSLSNVLIEGESGTGKELIAQSIHKASRPRRPFIAINCGAITKELLQSELFGYEEGAFTGAKKGGQPGKFELADGGTVFLDEVGEMPLDMQVSLLRCLQEKTVTRVGGAIARKIDVRIIAATNRCLSEEVKKGNFREDLYYRLNVIKIRMPSLRERIRDIPVLSRHILDNLSKTFDIAGPVKISQEAMDCLCRYEWPGNVRELQNCLESALIYMENNVIGKDCLPQQVVETRSGAYDDCAGNLREYERIAITETIIRNKGNISRSAKELGIARSTLYLKMEKLNITY